MPSPALRQVARDAHACIHARLSARAPLWGQLYLVGHLITDDEAASNDARMPRRLRVPNREVAYLYRSEFVDRAVRLVGHAKQLAL